MNQDESADSSSAEPAEETDGPDVTPAWIHPEPTGVRAVDDALAEIVEVDTLPTGEHVAVYDVVHRHLQDALADLDGS